MGERAVYERTICLVTDRRRLCASVGRALTAWPELLEHQLEGAIAGGIDLIQWREPDVSGRDALRFIQSMARRVPEFLDRLVVNERLDLALAAEAGGVHLKESSFSVRDARRLAPRKLIGRSVHADSCLPESHRGASYLIAGTTLRTTSKPEVVAIGEAGLQRLVVAVRPVPVLAIGGLTESAVPMLVRAGAGFAAIGWFTPSAGARIHEFVQNRVTCLRFAFDSLRSAP